MHFGCLHPLATRTQYVGVHSRCCSCSLFTISLAWAIFSFQARVNVVCGIFSKTSSEKIYKNKLIFIFSLAYSHYSIHSNWTRWPTSCKCNWKSWWPRDPIVMNSVEAVVRPDTGERRQCVCPHPRANTSSRKTHWRLSPVSGRTTATTESITPCGVLRLCQQISCNGLLCAWS